MRRSVTFIGSMISVLSWCFQFVLNSTKQLRLSHARFASCQISLLSFIPSSHPALSTTGGWWKLEEGYVNKQPSCALIGPVCDVTSHDWPSPLNFWESLCLWAKVTEDLRIYRLGSFFVSHLCSGVHIFFSFKFNKVPHGSVQSTNHVTPSPGSYSLSVSLSVKSGFILICSKHTVINLKTDRETDIDWHRHQKTNAAELTQWMPTSESMLQKKREREESGPVSPPSACFSDVSVFMKQEGWF